VTSQEVVLLIAPVILPPPNDNFSSRIVLAGVSNVVSGSNVAASKETNEPHHAGDVGGRSVWWSWTAANAGSFTISTLGSDFDTLLAIYTGSSLTDLSLVASNDDAQSSTRGSLVTLNATANTPYQIAVDGFNGDSGSIRLAINPVALPSLSGGAISDSGFQVTLTGETGLRYELQASTNLVTWMPLTSFLDAGEPFMFVDTSATNYNRKFYRLFRDP
jgi:hypothetical protein